jgi:hypothetical protein
MTPFMSAMGRLRDLIANLLSWWRSAHKPPPTPRYCQLFVEVVALLIYIRRQPDVTDDQKALIRTLLGAAQRILTADEWYNVLAEANRLLGRKPEIVVHWTDARDALETRLRDVD